MSPTNRNRLWRAAIGAAILWAVLITGVYALRLGVALESGRALTSPRTSQVTSQPAAPTNP